MSLLEAGTAAAETALRQIESRRDRSAADAYLVAGEAIAGVRERGDAFVREQVARFDGVTLGDVMIAPRKVTIGEELSRAIDVAIARVESFHRQQLPAGYLWTMNGTTVVHRVAAIDRAGLYVPGGRAVYLSTLIMTAVPARIAGVRDLVVATTPAAAERDELHFVCERLGIREIYRAGGAAGIAALALGTGTLRRVDKIVGPGNAYVTAAKARLFGTVGIDMLAGPTELVIIADETANSEFVAADLAAQAEHGADSAVICIWIGKGLDLPQATLNLVVSTAEQAVAIANRLAPEHLSIQTKDPARLASLADRAGAIFCGPSSPVAAGDYIAGPNHVLPTGGSARFASPLGVYDFVKRSNIVTMSEEDLSEAGPHAQRIARFEGLPLHAESLARRSLT